MFHFLNRVKKQGVKLMSDVIDVKDLTEEQVETLEKLAELFRKQAEKEKGKREEEGLLEKERKEALQALEEIWKKMEGVDSEEVEKLVEEAVRETRKAQAK
jgi:hypothetical protein